MNKQPLRPGMIDSHLHISEMTRKGLNAGQILKNCFNQGLEYAIDVGIETENFIERLTFKQDFPNLFLSAGLYPGFADAPEWRNMLAELENQLKQPGVIALGEIGLDRHWKYGKPGEQEALFEAQIELAHRHRLPLIIHNREADKGILAILKKQKPERGGIIHCFSSDYAFAKASLDLGFLISFAGNFTYTKADQLREVASRLPMHAILLETDAPYLPPQPVRGLKNQPEFVGHTYALMAEVKKIPLEKMIEQIHSNFQKLFNLKTSAALSS